VVRPSSEELNGVAMVGYERRGLIQEMFRNKSLIYHREKRRRSVE
jgi:hypothetical protein